jgi:hypothetical protein
MPKHFSDAINEIMPFVQNGDMITPFIIFHDTQDNFAPWFVEYPYSAETAKDALKECRESDPYAVMFTGADFDGGSFPFVFDKVICARLRAEYDAEAPGTLRDDEFRALINAVEDNIGSFSQKTIDYLLEYDKPLSALYDLNRIPLCNRDNPDGEYYDEDKIGAFVEAIESRFDEIQSRPKDAQIDISTVLFDAKSNEFPAARVISSLLINGVNIRLGEDTKQDRPFYVESRRGGETPSIMRTDNYAEALEVYAAHIDGRAFDMNLDRDEKSVSHGVEYVKLTDEHCLPDGKTADYTGKLIIVDANALLPEYRSSISQLVECSHGNGARPDAIGRSVFCTELYSGAAVVYDRSAILGVADEQALPKWAKMKLEIRQDPAIFEFGGFHFKPHRQFERRDGDFHKQMHNAVRDFSVGISAYNWGKTGYSHEKFYAASGGSDVDIFKCIENGKLYIPCENELFRYNEPPNRAKTAAAQKPDMLAKINNNKRKVERDKAANADAPKKTKTPEQEV